MDWNTNMLLSVYHLSQRDQHRKEIVFCFGPSQWIPFQLHWGHCNLPVLRGYMRWDPWPTKKKYDCRCNSHRSKDPLSLCHRHHVGNRYTATILMFHCPKQFGWTTSVPPYTATSETSTEWSCLWRVVERTFLFVFNQHSVQIPGGHEIVVLGHGEQSGESIVYAVRIKCILVLQLRRALPL